MQRAQILDWNEPNSRRACQQCHSKKTKCDKQRPVCGLCARTAGECAYPTKRKASQARSYSKEARFIQDSASSINFPPFRDRRSQSAQSASEALPSQFPPVVSLGPSNATPVNTPFAPSDSSGVPESTSFVSDQDSDQAVNVGGDIAWEPSLTANNVTLPQGKLYGLNDLPVEEQSGLIDVFFKKVQTWLPLLNQPKMYAKYIRHDGMRFNQLSVEEQLLFASMFALSARFSESPIFQGIHPIERGERFAEDAKMLYSLARTATEPSSLVYLQGCILLAFYYYASAPCARGWILTGVCVRLVYDLDLNNIDDDGGRDLEQEEWIYREELRRAWWLVWELDTFGSTISTRPYMIDKRRMNVLLPVSDTAWFTESPVMSTMLKGKPVEVWNKLQNCPNQDERAWFLVANYLMSLANDLLQSLPEVSQQEQEDLEAVCRCFRLALPLQFKLGTGTLAFDETNFARANWIICTHLMTARCLALLSDLGVARPTATGDMFVSAPFRDSKAQVHAAELSRIVNHWNPNFISAAHPFIACSVMPLPLASKGYPSTTAKDHPMDLIVCKSVVSHFSRVWGLGTILLSLFAAAEQPEGFSSADQNLLKRFAIFIPRPVRKKAGPHVISKHSLDHLRNGRRGSNDLAEQSSINIDEIPSSTNVPWAYGSFEASMGSAVDTRSAPYDTLQCGLGGVSCDIDVDGWGPLIPGFFDDLDRFGPLSFAENI
jgi:hypothetical protein